MTDDGRVVGVPVEVTSQIPGSTAQPLEGYLGNWMESAITLWQDLEDSDRPLHFTTSRHRQDCRYADDGFQRTTSKGVLPIRCIDG